MARVEAIQSLARGLPRSYEVWVYGCLKYRVGKIVYLAFSRDQTTLGFAFPRDWRPVLVDAEPHKFMLPRPSDMRFNWLVARLAAVEDAEMGDLVVEAWRMVVPKKVAAAYDAGARRGLPGQA